MLGFKRPSGLGSSTRTGTVCLTGSTTEEMTCTLVSAEKSGKEGLVIWTGVPAAMPAASASNSSATIHTVDESATVMSVASGRICSEGSTFFSTTTPSRGATSVNSLSARGETLSEQLGLRRAERELRLRELLVGFQLVFAGNGARFHHGADARELGFRDFEIHHGLVAIGPQAGDVRARHGKERIARLHGLAELDGDRGRTPGERGPHLGRARLVNLDPRGNRIAVVHARGLDGA